MNKIIVKEKEEKGLDLSGLNKEQRLAVETTEGPVVIIASAGSGKTHTMTYRLANLIEKGVPAENILMLTFTKKAGSEMKNRAYEMLGAKVNGLDVGTYHSFCAKYLKIYGYKIGLRKDFGVLDSPTSEDIIKKILESLNLPKDKNIKYPEAKQIAEILSAAVNKQKTVERIVKVKYPEHIKYIGMIEDVIRKYREYKEKNNVLDFDDLIVKMNLLLEEEDDLRKHLSDKFRYIMIDEYQDSNNLQMRLVRILRSFENKNICVVGDAAQSIYFWRSANYRNILNFHEMFPGTKTINLKLNYRSNQEIVDLANQILQGSSIRYNEPMVATYRSGVNPNFFCAEDEQDEARIISTDITYLVRYEDVSPNDIAVLARSSRDMSQLELNLMREHIPTKKYGGKKFLEYKDPQNLLALLQIVNGSAIDVYWYRILRLFPGVGPKAAEKIAKTAQMYGVDILETAPDVYGKKYESYILELVKHFRKMREMTDVSEIVNYALNRVYIPMYGGVLKSSTAKESYSVYETFRKMTEQMQFLPEYAGKYRSLGDLLTDLSLNPEESKDSDTPKVTLSTVHSAKGLEWDIVYLVNVTDGSYPGAREPKSNDPEAYEEYEEEIEEGRRLLYVAVTRARKHLTLSMPLVKSAYSDYQKEYIKSRFLTGE